MDLVQRRKQLRQRQVDKVKKFRQSNMSVSAAVQKQKEREEMKKEIRKEIEKETQKESMNIENSDGVTFARVMDIIGPTHMRPLVSNGVWKGTEQISEKKSDCECDDCGQDPCIECGESHHSVKEAKEEQGRSDYGKASVRNKRRFGTSGELPDPLTGKKITKDATRGELIAKRREEHKAKRGVKEELNIVEDDMKGMSVKSGHKRPTKSGAGMTQKGVEAYRRRNPGSKLKTAVTTEPSKLKKGSKAANRRKSYCARSAGQMKKFPKAAKDPNSRLRQARKRWNC